MARGKTRRQGQQTLTVVRETATPRNNDDDVPCPPRLNQVYDDGDIVEWYLSLNEYVQEQYSLEREEWWNRPESDFAAYGSEVHLRDLAQSTESLRSKIIVVYSLVERHGIATLFDKHRAMTSDERKDLAMDVIVGTGFDEEQSDCGNSLQDSPEYCSFQHSSDRYFIPLSVVPFLAGVAQGHLTRSVPSNSRWERMADPAHGLSATLPQSRGVQAFVEENYVARSNAFVSFTARMLHLLVDVPLPRLFLRPPAPAARQARLAYHARSRRQTLQNHSIDPEYYCAHCRVLNSVKKLSSYSACHKVNRRTNYCPPECSKADYPRHRTLCGSPLESSYSLPTSSYDHNTIWDRYKVALDKALEVDNAKKRKNAKRKENRKKQRLALSGGGVEGSEVEVGGVEVELSKDMKALVVDELD